MYRICRDKVGTSDASSQGCRVQYTEHGVYYLRGLIPANLRSRETPYY